MYGLKGFVRTWLKPEFRTLFDVVHKVLLSQSGTNDHVTHEIFKIMVVVYLNLPVNCLVSWWLLEDLPDLPGR